MTTITLKIRTWDAGTRELKCENPEALGKSSVWIIMQFNFENVAHWLLFTEYNCIKITPPEFSGLKHQTLIILGLQLWLSWGLWLTISMEAVVKVVVKPATILRP